MVSNFPSSSQGQFPHWGIQSTLSFALNPSGLLPLNLLYTSPFCCPWPNQWRVQKHHLKETENLWLQRPSRISIYLLLSPSSLASTWIKAKLGLRLQALLMLGSYLLAVCHCASSIWRPTQHSRTLLWRCFEVLLEQGCSRGSRRRSTKQKQSKTVCSTLGVFGMVSNFPSSSQGQFLHWGIQSTLSFALNPSGLLPLNLLYTSPFCCPWPNQRRVQKHHFEKQKIFGFKGLHAFLYLLLSPSSLASTWIKAKLRLRLQALLMLGSYLLAVCHCASSIWRPTQHSRTLLWRCFEVLLEQGCSRGSRRRSTKQKQSKTIKNSVQHTGCFWNGVKLSIKLTRSISALRDSKHTQLCTESFWTLAAQSPLHEPVLLPVT